MCAGVRGLVTMNEDLRRSPKLVLEHVNKTAVAMKFQGDSNTKAWLKGRIKYKDDPEIMYLSQVRHLVVQPPPQLH
jgi:hypothetical protein